MTEGRKYGFSKNLLIMGLILSSFGVKSSRAETPLSPILLSESNRLPVFDLFEQARSQPGGPASAQFLQFKFNQLESTGQAIHYALTLVSHLNTKKRPLALRRLESFVLAQPGFLSSLPSLQAAKEIACFALATHGSERELKLLIHLALSSAPLSSECALGALRNAGYVLSHNQLRRGQQKKHRLSLTTAQDLALRLKLQLIPTKVMSWNQLLNKVKSRKNRAEVLRLFRELVFSEQRFIAPLNRREWLLVFQSYRDEEDLFLLMALGQEPWLTDRLKNKWKQARLLNTQLKLNLEYYFNPDARPKVERLPQPELGEAKK